MRAVPKRRETHTGDYAARETVNEAGQALEVTLETDLDFRVFLARRVAHARAGHHRSHAAAGRDRARYSAGNVGLALNCEYRRGFAFPAIFLDEGTTPVVIVSFPPKNATH